MESSRVFNSKRPGVPVSGIFFDILGRYKNIDFPNLPFDDPNGKLEHIRPTGKVIDISKLLVNGYRG